MDITLHAASECICKKITVPGDKSISHRALLFSAIAEGSATVRGLSPGADVKSMADCLETMGVPLRWQGESCRLQGVGLDGLTAPTRPLDAGNSGTAMRLLLGALAGQRFDSILGGDDSLSRRPMARVIEPLHRMGAHIEAKADKFAPLHIKGKPLNGVRYDMPVASAQVQSALLLAGLYADGDTVVVEPAPVRDHTERMFAHLGVTVERRGAAVSLHPGSPLKARDIDVPGDPSSAAFWLAAGALASRAEITVSEVCVNPTRTGFLDVLERMGVAITRQGERTSCNEPRADLTVVQSPLNAIEVGGELIPRLIDELPLVAVLATQAQGTTVVRDAAELRVKETDRIAAVTANLRKMNVDLEEHEDGWTIHGPQPLKGASLDAFGDHRIAMAFAVAALVAESPTTLHGAEWADISYPGFFEQLEQLRD